MNCELPKRLFVLSHPYPECIVDPNNEAHHLPIKRMFQWSFQEPLSLTPPKLDTHFVYPLDHLQKMIWTHFEESHHRLQNPLIELWNEKVYRNLKLIIFFSSSMWATHLMENILRTFATILSLPGWDNTLISLSFSNSSHLYCQMFNSFSLKTYYKLFWSAKTSTLMP